MDANLLVTLSGECFRATFQHSQGIYFDCLSYLFILEDLVKKRGIRRVNVVFTRPAMVNAGDFKSRENILCWNAMRKGFDEKKLDFEIEPDDPDKYIELKVKGTDIDASQGGRSDETILDYLKAKAYWVGYKYKTYQNPAPTVVSLESEEDLDYLGATLDDLRRVAERMRQQGLLTSSGFPLATKANPTEKLLKEFEARASEVPLLKEHERILDLAAQDKLPETIDSASFPTVHVVQELIDAGYLKAVDASSFDGAAYLNPKITLAGREYLAHLKEEPEEEQMKEKKLNNRPLDLPMAISGGPAAWLAIEREYDVSKKTLGKRLSFVKDKFKRKVIFRDIEQAFLLAHSGFNKSSVILAGGVIEELLRLYLAHMDVKPENSNLDSYIKACEAKKLIKGAIPKLADSVRHFRNYVHLEKENSRKESISKSAAKGAVSSVFTIASELTT